VTIDITQPWRSVPVLSVDFEASSADPQTCEPVELACVRYEQGAIVARYSTLLRTKEPIPEDSTAIHGITNEMVANQPTLEEVAHELVKISDGAVPMAFNSAYDRKVMHRYLSGEGVSLFDPAQAWICTLAMAWHKDRFEPGTGRLKLAACCQRRGINIVGAHRAEADALMSGALFFALMAGVDTTMEKLLTSVAKLSEEREKDHAAYRKRMREQDRVLWRQYACSAIEGLAASSRDAASALARDAAEIADGLLDAEKSRWL
jgi:DNA polymerase III epsilon subunit-like protein